MNPFCEHFGLAVPVLNAGMGFGIAGPDLAAAVSGAGGLGVLGLGGYPKAEAMEAIRALRAVSSKPFGANHLLPLRQEGGIEACFEERIPLLILFWGDPAPFVSDARRAGTQLFAQVGSAEEAVRAADAGVDGVVIQGVEAGGHVKARDPIEQTLTETVAALGPLPVIASGGIRNGRDIRRALSLGASAVSIGSRYVATPEARVAEAYKQRIVEARAEDTVLTELFGVGWTDAPHRVLRNKAYEEWEAAGCPPVGERPGEGRRVGILEVPSARMELLRYTVTPPLLGADADLDELALYAGESCEAIDEIVGAREVTRRLAAEFEVAVASKEDEANPA